VSTPVAEQITFYEEAIRIRDLHKQLVERIPEAKAKVEASGDPRGLEEFEKRAQMVERNYAKSQRKVEGIETKLAALRGG
jgi:hypothetical protein